MVERTGRQWQVVGGCRHSVTPSAEPAAQSTTADNAARTRTSVDPRCFGVSPRRAESSVWQCAHLPCAKLTKSAANQVGTWAPNAGEKPNARVARPSHYAVRASNSQFHWGAIIRGSCWRDAHPTPDSCDARSHDASLPRGADCFASRRRRLTSFINLASLNTGGHQQTQSNVRRLAAGGATLRDG